MDDIDIKKAENNLKKELEQNIIQKMTGGADENSVLIKDGSVVNLSSETAPYKDDVKFAVVHVIAEISVPILKKDDIVNYLAKKYFKIRFW